MRIARTDRSTPTPQIRKDPMKKTLQIATIAAALALVAGCQPSSPSSPATPQPAKTPTTLEIDLRSPDQALKTWWRFIDMRYALDFEECLSGHRDRHKGPLKFVAQIATGDTLRALDPQSPANICQHETFSRQIQEVKTESETRAVVSALIKNVTDIPPRAVHGSSELAWREKGFRYRYVLEKTIDGHWKVAQVFKYQDYLSRDEMVYAERDRPPYPSFAHHQ